MVQKRTDLCTDLCTDNQTLHYVVKNGAAVAQRAWRQFTDSTAVVDIKAIASRDKSGAQSFSLSDAPQFFMDAQANQHRCTRSQTRTHGNHRARCVVRFTAHTVRTFASEESMVREGVADLSEMTEFGSVHSLRSDGTLFRHPA